MKAISNRFLTCLGIHLLFLELLVSAAEVTSVEDIGMSLKPFITTSLPPRKLESVLLETNVYPKKPQLSSISTTTKQLPPTPSITTSIINKQDDLVSVTSVANINRKDLDAIKPGDDDNHSKPIIVFTIHRNLTLNCDSSQIVGETSIRWERNGTDVSEVPSLKGRYKIKDHKFSIDKTIIDDADIYSCLIKQGSAEIRRDFHAAAQVEVRVPSNLGVVEGETLKIQCVAVGTRPILTWEHGNNTYKESSGRFVLKNDDNNLQNAILEIVNVSLEDRGEYKCVGRNYGAEGAGKLVEDTTYVRVKGKLAALWPFLGICAEVLILCAVILIYEKKRNKTDLDESDTDPNTEQEKLKTQRN